MCWVDAYSIKQILKLKNIYRMTTFVETGAFRGANIRFHSFHWEKVLSCDICEEYLKIAIDYNKDRSNVYIKDQSSPDFLKDFIKKYKKEKRDDIIFFFLDAHFYDPLLPKGEKWVVVNELKALRGFKNCVICIHDFDCKGLGHCCYDGQPLGFPLVLEDLKKVNKDFYFYVNKKEYCDIYNEETIKNVKELIIDNSIIDTIKNTNSCERLKYRGILYCTPDELNLNEFELERA